MVSVKCQLRSGYRLGYSTSLIRPPTGHAKLTVFTGGHIHGVGSNFMEKPTS